jgi:hypothetical protein
VGIILFFCQIFKNIYRVTKNNKPLKAIQPFLVDRRCQRQGQSAGRGQALLKARGQSYRIVFFIIKYAKICSVLVKTTAINGTLVVIRIYTPFATHFLLKKIDGLRMVCFWKIFDFVIE